MIRGLLYWVLGIVVTVIMWCFAVVVYPFVRKRADFMHKTAHIWCLILVAGLCRVKIEVVGRENFYAQDSCIIVSNHRSYADILVGLAAVPVQFRWLSKKSLFRLPLLGLAMKMAGYIPIQREKSMASFKSLESVKHALVEKLRPVWIFPEGTRTPASKLRRFKRGAFILARETSKPVLPVTLINTDNIFENMLKVKAKQVKVVAGSPVYYSDFKTEKVSDRESLDRMIAYTRNKIQQTYNSYASQSQ
ncbi:MAG: lysophospholipid acyltransferase family protein [Spirochaetota bacterium]